MRYKNDMDSFRRSTVDFVKREPREKGGINARIKAPYAIDNAVASGQPHRPVEQPVSQLRTLFAANGSKLQAIQDVCSAA